ncbi:MAG: class I SAM-dependent methyltransferase [Deltaproteobacteria bacterium]|nr:class I SAM-dependent methyltransferase [Deltaproteobacteria bacterium]
MGRTSLTVLWPKDSSPEIDEIRFAYDFCRRISETLCHKETPEISFIDVRKDTTVGQIRPLVQADELLVVTEPEIVISAYTIRALTRCLEKGYFAAGPVYNRTAFPHQIASLPMPYLNIATYLELAEILEGREHAKCIEAEALDPACILYPAHILDGIEPECHIFQIQQAIREINGKGAAVASGALVHFSFKKSFEAERGDLIRLVPKDVKKVLDVGCAMGGYGKSLKQVRPDIFITGVELNPAMAEAARSHYDEIVISSIEETGLRSGYDLINCGDIVEHLKEPWAMMAHLHGLLKTDGYLTLSVPNVGHWTVVKDLLKGTFEYMPLGILCIGHLRWFTESSVRQALDVAGFQIDIFEREQIPPTPNGQMFIEHMCASGFGDKSSLMTNEFIIRAIKTG